MKKKVVLKKKVKKCIFLEFLLLGGNKMVSKSTITTALNEYFVIIGSKPTSFVGLMDLIKYPRQLLNQFTIK